MSKRGKKHMNPGLRKQQDTPRPKAHGRNEFVRGANAALEAFKESTDMLLSNIVLYDKFQWYKARVQETLRAIFEHAETSKGQSEVVIHKRIEFLSSELAGRIAELRNAALEANEPLIMEKFNKWNLFVSLMQDEIGKVLDKNQTFGVQDLLQHLGDSPESEQWQNTLKTIVLRNRGQNEARLRCAEQAYLLKENNAHLFGGRYGMQKVAFKLIDGIFEKSKLFTRLPKNTQAELDWLIEPYIDCGYLDNGKLPDDFRDRKKYGNAITIMGRRLGEARREYETALSTDDN